MSDRSQDRVNTQDNTHDDATGAHGDPSQGPRLAHHNEDASGLVARQIGKSFNKKRVIRNVSFNVKRGEAVGLLGPNGAGKTTCFYMISGLIKNDEGRVILDQSDITNVPVFRRAQLGIGYLPQEASIFRGLTVEQNIRAILETVESDLENRNIMLEELLVEFDIGHLRAASALTLSGGERRRVEIARALAARPTFLLLDEPLAGIDPIAISEIRELISQLKNHGLGVLITDHNVRDTLNIVDRAYILHDGRVLMSGTPDEVVSDRGVQDVYLGNQFSR
jgi:lipopolysaccharide export system ATP-binding protein